MIKGAKFGPSHDVYLASGHKIQGLPGYASKDDVLVGTLGISGNTRTLRLITAECGNLIPSKATLVWANKKYLVINTALLASGAVTVAYLSEDTNE